MSATKSSKSSFGLPYIPESAEVISIQLAIWRDLTMIETVLAMGQQIRLPRLVDGVLQDALTDLDLAMAALYECSVARPAQMIAAQREIQARARAAIEAETDAAKKMLADVTLSEAEATTEQAFQTLQEALAEVEA